MVLVKKNDGSTRFWIHYHCLYQTMKVDAYQLPHKEEYIGGSLFLLQFGPGQRLLAD